MMKNLMRVVGLAAVLSMGAALAQSCTVSIGSIMSLTGSLGVLGEAIAQGAQLGVADLNTAGGVNGCEVNLALADDQTQASVGVDAAKRLVDVQHVPAIVGALASGVTTAIVSSVTSPSHVILISPSSTSPALTQMAKDGTTQGYFFRTAPSDALQGVAIAKVAIDAGVTSVAVMYLNNDYGQGLSESFIDAYEKLGGSVTQNVIYNPDQPSYRAEVNRALGGNPQGLFLIGYPGDGTTIAREWVASGGPQVWLLPDGLEDQSFVDSVGGQYMQTVYGTAPGTNETPSLQNFRDEFTAEFGALPTQPYVTNAYDATIVIGLAMMYAGTNTDTAAIRDAVAKVTDPDGEPVYAGADELEAAQGLINLGETIQYVGATGPVRFDQYGDMAGPYVLWTVQDGTVTETGMMTVQQIADVQQQIAE